MAKLGIPTSGFLTDDPRYDGDLFIQVFPARQYPARSNNGLYVLHQRSKRYLICIGNYVKPELRLPRLSRAVNLTDACCLFRFALAAMGRGRSDGLWFSNDNPECHTPLQADRRIGKFKIDKAERVRALLKKHFWDMPDEASLSTGKKTVLPEDALDFFWGLRRTVWSVYDAL